MSSTGKVTGLVSGWDTTSIVESLMAMEKKPYEKLDVKKQTEELKLQAYQAVNTYLMKFRNSISTLSSTKLWNSKAASSSNEKSLTATASEYAVNGTYSFKVAQLATVTQYMSQGFASSKTPLVKQEEEEEPYKLGTINLSSAKTRVDNSAKLDTLNGGKGIFRGSVRVTDASGSTSIIDLSSCDTMDDVVRTLNESTTAQINASIKDGTLHIEDASGGGGVMKVQNVGAGTAATDLGIAGSSVKKADGTYESFISGRNVYTLGQKTSIKELNDGLGAEGGMFEMMIVDEEGYSLTLSIDTEDCETVGDIMKKANAKLDEVRASGTHDSKGGLHSSQLEGLYFGVSGDGTSFALTGTKKGLSYSFGVPSTGLQSNADAVGGLGLNGTKTATKDGEELRFDRILGDVNSPMLKNLNGASGCGIGNYESDTSSMVDVPFNDATPIAALNGGKGLSVTQPLLQIQVHAGSKDIADLDPDNLREVHPTIISAEKMQDFLDANPNGTLGGLKTFINDSIAQYAIDNPNDKNTAALKGLYIDLDSDGVSRFSVFGAQGGYAYEIGGSLAGALGLNRSAEWGTAVESYNDHSSAGYLAYEEQMKQVYNLDGVSLVDSGNSIEDDTTLGDMLKNMHGYKEDDFATDQDYLDAVAAWEADVAADAGAVFNKIFGEGIKMTTIFDASNGTSVDIKWADIFKDENGDPVAFDGDITAKQFMDDINAALKDAYAGKTDTTGNDIIAPKLGLNPTGNAFAWNNIDFNYAWAVEGIDGSGAVDPDAVAFSNLGLDSITNLATQSEHAVKGSLSVKMPGYLEQTTVNKDTASSVTLGEFNYGFGLIFGEETDELSFSLGKDADGNDVTFNITMKELADKMVANWPATSGAFDQSKVTAESYLNSLNELVAEKLVDVNQNLSAAKQYDFKFQFGENKIELTGFKNIKNFSMSGELANPVRTGLSPVLISTKENISEEAVYNAGDIYAGEFHSQIIEGLGEIALSLGGAEEVRLKTDGLTQTSTLSDLIDKLNSELDELAKLHPDEGYEEIRFLINDSGTGIAVENGSNKSLVFKDTAVVTKDPVTGAEISRVSDAQFLAQDLGLIKEDATEQRIDPYSFHNASTLHRSMISRATSLKDYLGDDYEEDGFRITNSLGVAQNLSFQNLETIGDLVDYINDVAGTIINVRAQINANGDGIDILEEWGTAPSYGTEGPGQLTIQDMDGSTSAKKLGLTGTGTQYGANFVFEGSLNKSIDVMSNDSLESIMYRISAAGDYKCAIINDGSSANPFRLTISSANTGEADDFVIDMDNDLFGFNQTSRAKDSKVLYGDPNSNASPVMLSSSTNTNSNAILGLTLNLTQASSDWTTITVDTDKEKVKEEIKTMVESYNELAGIISYLDAYDEETGEPGILFGDSTVRSLMDDINDFFYAIHNPNNVKVGSVGSDGKQATWTWMDLGVELTATQSNADGTGGWYTTMDLDLDKLDDMVASNWDVLSSMLAGERNAANINAEKNVQPTASFNGDIAEGYSIENAINGDKNSTSFGPANGVMADGTIEDGQNEYTIWFQQAVSMTRMSIYHVDTATALKDYTVEYMDGNGEWQTFREITGNKSDANHLGTALPITAQAIRIKADDTNASDGKFRLLDIQVYEQTGLAGKLNQYTTTLGDTQEGFLATRNTEIQSNISDIKEQMDRLQERLDAKEESLWRRFTAMETAMGKLQNQGSYFSTMMSSMNSSSS